MSLNQDCTVIIFTFFLATLEFWKLVGPPSFSNKSYSVLQAKIIPELNFYHVNIIIPTENSTTTFFYRGATGAIMFVYDKSASFLRHTAGVLVQNP